MSYHSKNKVVTRWKDGAVKKTKDSFAKECNINNIVKKFVKTNSLPVIDGNAFYGDFSNIPDYQTALNRVNAVSAVFRSLNADVRARFKHDPANMLEFVSNPDNRDEAVKLGLLPKPKTNPTYVDKDGNPIVKDPAKPDPTPQA